MVNRGDKRKRFFRWRIYFANTPQARAWKQILRDVAHGGRVRITFEDISPCMIELVWQVAVTFDSAYRLIKFAKENSPSFEILGSPQGLRMTWTKLRQLRPQALRMTRVEPQMKLRLLL